MMALTVRESGQQRNDKLLKTLRRQETARNIVVEEGCLAALDRAARQVAAAEIQCQAPPPAQAASSTQAQVGQHRRGHWQDVETAGQLTMISESQCPRCHLSC